MRLVSLALVALLCAAPAISAAQEPAAPSPTELRRQTVGRWTGALGYRDYQSDQLFEIPVATTIALVGDGVTQVRTSLFDDGPDKPVWITSVSLDDPAAGTVTSASYRAGRPVELDTESMTVAAWRDATHWTIVYSTTGEDDEQPADIRVTETRDGDDLTSVKEVRPVGAGDDAWRFRNQTRLSRLPD